MEGLTELEQLRIQIENKKYGTICLTIVPRNSKKDKLFLCSSPYPGESKYQIQEGCEYQYEFCSDTGRMYQFDEETDIILFSSLHGHPCMGTMQTGNYVGQLNCRVRDIETGEIVGTVSLDIRSVKEDYEHDYRQMLDDIANYYTDLVLLQSSPVTQSLEIDRNADSMTLYQHFCFIRSIVDSDSFHEAIHKIETNPVKKWTETTVSRPIQSVRRFNRRMLRQIVTSQDRIQFSEGCFSDYELGSVPRLIEVDSKKDTIDNVENQFVKMVLHTFYIFCLEFKQMKNASNRLKKEADICAENISSMLQNQFFRQISLPTHLNMNSPVLQRKEGYREVLQAWVIHDLAAKLNWKGGENIYQAGKKDVATLYEYWLFFKLQELISKFFNLDMKDKEDLVKKDSDGINLNIIQGRQTVIKGKSVSDLRTLNVAFYYNRTFKHISDPADSIHKAGSWTMAMRPDYTLSIWPGDVTQDEAEAQDLIVHIHFDAKYRLNKILLDDSQEDDTNINKELIEEKQQQAKGIYLRADLLKMHAYKDAIRRTSGAYIIYPGTEKQVIRGFHEIIPGLGAFCIRPNHWSEDSQYLIEFISQVKEHMLNRTSQREKLSFYEYDIHNVHEEEPLVDRLPEPANENRDFLPDETTVIVAYYKNKEHLEWILKNHLYNLRAGSSKGSVVVSKELVSARYLLLYHDNDIQPLYRLLKEGPKIYTSQELIDMGYPNMNAESKIYLVYKLNSRTPVDKEFKKAKWNSQEVMKLVGKPGRNKAIRLSELIERAKY